MGVRMRTSRSICVLLAAAAATLLAQSAANPTNFAGATGSTGCGLINMADGVHNTYYYGSLTANVSTAMNWTRANNLDPTDMSSEVVSTVQSNTDALVYDSDYSNFC